MYQCSSATKPDKSCRLFPVESVSGFFVVAASSFEAASDHSPGQLEGVNLRPPVNVKLSANPPGGLPN